MTDGLPDIDEHGLQRIYENVRGRISLVADALPEALYDTDRTRRVEKVNFLDTHVVLPIAGIKGPTKTALQRKIQSERRQLAIHLLTLASDYSSASSTYLGITPLTLVEILQQTFGAATALKGGIRSQSYEQFSSQNRDVIRELEKNPSVRGERVAELLSRFDSLTGHGVLHGIHDLGKFFKNRTIKAAGDVFSPDLFREVMERSRPDRDYLFSRLMNERTKREKEKEERFTLRNSIDSSNAAFVLAANEYLNNNRESSGIRVTKKDSDGTATFLTGLLPKPFKSDERLQGIARSHLVPVLIYSAFANASPDLDITGEANIWLEKTGHDARFLMKYLPETISKSKKVSPQLAIMMDSLYHSRIKFILGLSESEETNADDVERMLATMSNGGMKHQAEKNVEEILKSLSEMDIVDPILNMEELTSQVSPEAKPYLKDILNRLDKNPTLMSSQEPD